MGNVVGEVSGKIRTSKLGKWKVKLGVKPTTEGLRLWIHPVKRKNGGKWEYVEAGGRSSSAENGDGPARSQTDSRPIYRPPCNLKRIRMDRTWMVLAVQ